MWSFFTTFHLPSSLLSQSRYASHLSIDRCLRQVGEPNQARFVPTAEATVPKSCPAPGPVLGSHTENTTTDFDAGFCCCMRAVGQPNAPPRSLCSRSRCKNRKVPEEAHSHRLERWRLALCECACAAHNQTKVDRLRYKASQTQHAAEARQRVGRVPFREV
jgi:hypothetical protein